MVKSFESWVFSVNFGDAKLYEKHRGYMKIGYRGGQKSIIDKVLPLLNNCYNQLWVDEHIDLSNEVLGLMEKLKAISEG